MSDTLCIKCGCSMISDSSIVIKPISVCDDCMPMFKHPNIIRVGNRLDIKTDVYVFDYRCVIRQDGTIKKVRMDK